MTDNTIPLTSKHIGSMSSMTQGVDNQYVPLAGLKRMEKKKWTREKFRPEISESIKAEIRRALLYSDSVVINRAFITNTNEIYQPILDIGTEREAIISLFKSKAIIPYLYNEKHILDEGTIIKENEGLMAIEELVRELDRVACIRLSWDETENADGALQLARSFTSYLSSAYLVADLIAHDLGVKDVAGFKSRLVDVSRFCLDTTQSTGQDYVTRTQVYSKFLCVEGNTVEETRENINKGKYDFNKPFWKELKQVFDLKYQANLTDKLRIQTFSAIDLPERTTLREVDLVASGVKTGEFIDLSVVFGQVVYGALRKGLWLERINDLTLEDIVRIRRSDEHKKFIQASGRLKEDADRTILDLQRGEKGADHPLDFAGFYDSFCEYQEAIAKIPAKKSAEKIQPVIKTIITIGGVTLTFSAAATIVKVAGAVAALKDDSASLTAKTIAGAAKRVDLALDFNFMRTRIASAKDEYHRLIDTLRLRGYEIDMTDVLPATSSNGTLATGEPSVYPEQ